MKFDRQTVFYKNIPVRTEGTTNSDTYTWDLFVIDFGDLCGCPIDYNSSSIEVPEIHSVRGHVNAEWDAINYPDAGNEEPQQQFLDFAVFRNDPRVYLPRLREKTWEPPPMNTKQARGITYLRAQKLGAVIADDVYKLTDWMIDDPNMNSIIWFGSDTKSEQKTSLGGNVVQTVSNYDHTQNLPTTWEYSTSEFKTIDDGMPLFDRKAFILSTSLNFGKKGDATNLSNRSISEDQEAHFQIRYSWRTIPMNEFLLRNRGTFFQVPP